MVWRGVLTGGEMWGGRTAYVGWVEACAMVCDSLGLARGALPSLKVRGVGGLRCDVCMCQGRGEWRCAGVSGYVAQGSNCITCARAPFLAHTFPIRPSRPLTRLRAAAMWSSRPHAIGGIGYACRPFARPPPTLSPSGCVETRQAHVRAWVSASQMSPGLALRMETLP